MKSLLSYTLLLMMPMAFATATIIAYSWVNDKVVEIQALQSKADELESRVNHLDIQIKMMKLDKGITNQ